MEWFNLLGWCTGFLVLFLWVSSGILSIKFKSTFPKGLLTGKHNLPVNSENLNAIFPDIWCFYHHFLPTTISSINLGDSFPHPHILPSASPLHPLEGWKSCNLRVERRERVDTPISPLEPWQVIFTVCSWTLLLMGNPSPLNFLHPQCLRTDSWGFKCPITFNCYPDFPLSKVLLTLRPHTLIMAWVEMYYNRNPTNCNCWVTLYSL